MTGFEIYNLCRTSMNRKKVNMDSYLNSNQVNYYESLADFFLDKGFTIIEARKYINSVFRDDPTNFTPFELMSEESQNIYKKWKKNNLTKADYYNFIQKSFTFIENFCIKKNISFKKYCKKYLKDHIREEKIDFTIPVYLKLIDIKKLSNIEKILLKKFVREYNVIEYRIQNKTIKTILENRSKEMLYMISCSVNSNISSKNISMTAST